MASANIAIDAFARQFQPVEGGYLYYPSKHAGGKLVTAGEYAALMEGWRSRCGLGGQMKIVGMVFAVIFLHTLLQDFLNLPDWSDHAVSALCLVMVIGWILPASAAPRRLVKDRPDITPPRTTSDVKRDARRLIGWPVIAGTLALSGLGFASALTAPEQTVTWWLWTLGSGALFSAYLWIAVRKWQDG